MTGEEVSFFCLVDGETVVPFGSAQDHKRVGDGDTGPNTGGMGAYSPASIFTPELEQRALDEIVRPTARALAEAGTPFSGILYAGLMLTPEGPKLVEYNVRFGDPECQVLMLRLESDLLALMLRHRQGRARHAPRRRSSRTIPPSSSWSRPWAIRGRRPKAARFPAWTCPAPRSSRPAPLWSTASWSRAAAGCSASTASGATVAEAQRAAYAAVDAVDFPDGFCRRDIGWREIAREPSGRVYEPTHVALAQSC